MKPRLFLLTFILTLAMAADGFAKPNVPPPVNRTTYEAVDFVQQNDTAYVVMYQGDAWNCPGALNGIPGMPVLMDTTHLSTSRGCQPMLVLEHVVFQGLEKADDGLLVFKITRQQKPWLCQDANSPGAQQALASYSKGDEMQLPQKKLNAKCHEDAR